MAKQATDTFVVVLSDGTERVVTKGQVLQNNHEVVRHAPTLFTEFDTGDKPAAEEPVKRGPGRPRKDAS
jgi:hypothetical protein